MTLLEICEDYARLYDAGEYPTLLDLVTKHSEHAGELTEFVLCFHAAANRERRRIMELLCGPESGGLASPARKGLATARRKMHI